MPTSLGESGVIFRQSRDFTIMSQRVVFKDLVRYQLQALARLAPVEGGCWLIGTNIAFSPFSLC